MQSYKLIQLPFGNSNIKVKIPLKNYLGTMKPNKVEGLKNIKEELEESLQNPFGTKKLSEIAKEKQGIACIVINDITRPTPTKKLLPKIIDQLKIGGIDNQNIIILVATGTHRANTRDELEKMVGFDILKNFKVINHNSKDPEELEYLGKTKRGIPVQINKWYYKANIKILTGTIAPHQSAGYSGGRKSILPGISGEEALKMHHSYKLRMEGPAMGKLKNNYFHEEAIEAAKIAGVDFIVNVVQNSKKEVVKIVSGHFLEAWIEGVKWAKKVHEVDAPATVPDIVITSPGKFPRNVNLYQSQKAISPAEEIVKKGGTIILVSDCPEGIGGGNNFQRWLKEANSCDEVIERFKREGYSDSSNKAFLYARCLKKAKITLVNQSISSEIAQEFFLDKEEDIQKVLDKTISIYGQDSKVLIIKNAPEIIPKLNLNNIKREVI